MDDTLISLFIDDEMNLEEKISFVETVSTDMSFVSETLALLEQEKMLWSLPKEMPKRILDLVPRRPLPSVVPPVFAWQRLLAGIAVSILLTGALFLMLSPPQVTTSREHRFVIYLPEAEDARVIGSFTGWQPVAMNKVGDSGYWTLTMRVQPGEHRYSYLVEEGRRMVDPTVALASTMTLAGKIRC